ncbi:MAG TPA: dihydrofolate reductase family protein [Anaerolineaceae bacterium]|nr:dihydrofolate reductase family protein [Anaerolineaceae bacterium]
MEKIHRLYPLPTQEYELNGLYLAHDLRQYRHRTDRPYFYADFVASLDGRIAIPGPGPESLVVPNSITNPRDWRLFQELAAQADIILSSGRYLREWTQGKAQQILQVADPRFADLSRWRAERSLPPQADIAILSRSLDFPIPPELTQAGRRVVIFTSGSPDPGRVAEIEARAGKVIVAGQTGVDGSLLARRLSELGYCMVYSAAGPRVLDLLVEGLVLDRLYLTQVSKILGGRPDSSILEGPLLTPPAIFQPYHVYLDPLGPSGSSQLFMSYDRI